MIDSIANRIAVSMKKVDEYRTPSIDVMRFSLVVIFNNFLTIVLSLSIGWLTGKLVETTIVLIASALLRAVSGGFHFQSALVCAIVSSLIVSTIPHIPVHLTAIIILTGVSFLLACFFAPANIQNQTRIPEKYFPLLKVIALLLIASNFFIHSGLLALSFFAQAVSLIHVRKEV